MVVGQSGNENIAIIPARSGSKRLPNKNMIEFNGKPMIYWTLKAAIDSKVFHKILFLLIVMK